MTAFIAARSFSTRERSHPRRNSFLWTLTGAFQEFRQIEEGSASEQWLEGRLVEVFLARTASGSTDDVSMAGSSVDVPSSHAPSSDAVELVVFRRWSYREASSVLETGVD